jgi:fucose permease
VERAFVRAGRTWVAYLALAYYGYLLNALGPAMPFLRGDLRLSYTASSLHTSAFALGMLIAGLTGDRAVRAYGRRRAMIVALGGLGGGSLLLVAGRVFPITLGGAIVMGTLGSLVVVLVPAILTDQHGRMRAVALSEANAISSGSGMLAPLLVGALARTVFGWRAAFVLGLLFLVPLAMQLRAVTLPAVSGTSDRDPAGARLPLVYWVYWLTIVWCVSMEFCMVFWTADFLHSVARVPGPLASALVGVFLGAMLLGRVVGSRVSHFFTPDRVVLPAFALVAVGFPLYWLAAATPIRIAGLFMTGAGIANLYPLILALAMGTAPRASAAASARATLASATAIGTAPLILGWLADRAGIDTAYGLVLVLLGLAVLSSRLARRLEQGR